MEKIILTTVDQVAPSVLHAFLQKVYPSAKSAFLQSHGNWWYRGDANRWILLLSEKVGGCSGVIPCMLWMKGKKVPAIWWVDLVIAPEFRGQGHQAVFDERIRNLTDLKVGFPNELAAKIHKKHNWGVRDDFQVRLLPLNPSKIKAVRHSHGVFGIFLRFIACCCSPLAYVLFRLWVSYSKPKKAFCIQDVDAQFLADIFNRYERDDLVTTYRDVDYFQWRYLDAPYFEELAFYAAGPNHAPTHYLIARHIPSKVDNHPITRILDIFGDFSNQKSLTELIKLVVMDAIQKGSVQVTTMSTLPEIKTVALRTGFWIYAKARFCWLSQHEEWMKDLDSQVYWVLGDSDNDEPV